MISPTRGKLTGKVAFVTGAARGQGRSHAIRLAQEGADVIGVDICSQIDSVPYPMSTEADLADTAKAVEAEGRRFVAQQADVRDPAAVKAAFDAGVAELGAVDIVVANAGISPLSHTPTDREWFDVLDVNLTGVYHTVRTAIPSMIERRTGSIVLTSSVAALVSVGCPDPGFLGYVASKTGVVGLMKAWANYLAPYGIRVNSVAPTGCRTPMVVNDFVPEFLATSDAWANSSGNALPVDLIEPEDVANAVAWLVSDEARYVTGTVLPIDAGSINKR